MQMPVHFISVRIWQQNLMTRLYTVLALPDAVEHVVDLDLHAIPVVKVRLSFCAFAAVIIRRGLVRAGHLSIVHRAYAGICLLRLRNVISDPALRERERVHTHTDHIVVTITVTVRSFRIAVAHSGAHTLWIYAAR